jgi:hypothetical protein
VARTSTFSQVLWLLTTVWLAACGRLGFDELGGGVSKPLPDAPIAPDGQTADALTPDAPPDATLDGPVAAPNIEVASSLALVTTCGAAPAESELVVTNTGTAELTIASATATNAFAVTSGPTAIAAGDSATFAIAPPMAVVGTDRGGTSKTGTLTLMTNAGTRTVQLAAAVQGANLAVSVTDIAFVASDGSCPGPRTVTISNTGNTSVAIDPLPADGVTLSGFTGGTIDANSSTSVTIDPSRCGRSSTVLPFDAASGSSSDNAVCVTATVNITLNITASSTSGCACS